MLLRNLKTVFHRLTGIFRQSPQDKTMREMAIHRKPTQIVQSLQSEDWAGLRQHFFLPLRWLLSPAVLKKAFDLVRLTAGSLEHAGSPVVSTGWLTSVKVPVRFKRAKLALSLTLTPYGSLVGLNFLPQSLAGFGNAWQPPTYARSMKVEEIELELGKSKLKVKGTLTLPQRRETVPCVVMLAGSGPIDRDSTVDACKPFKDLALGLAGCGIATIRFDKVTFAHGNQLRFHKSFSLSDEYLEHASDAILQAVIHNRIRRDAIFVLGHSLGGYVAPQVASMEPPCVAGCILMAAPSIPMHQSALKQLRHFAAMDGESISTDSEQIKELKQQCDVVDDPGLSMTTPRAKLPFGIGPAYWLSFRMFSPLETASLLQKPILCLQGGRDYQVTVDKDYADWRTALEDQPKATFRLYESLNHPFIAGEQPSTPLEYDTPGNVDEQVIKDISRWVFETLPCREPAR